MTTQEWVQLALTIGANVVAVSVAVARMSARLAVIETKLRYIEHELSLAAPTTH